MKNTGIVRRIDELGRIVIPKEMRRTLRLHEGSQVEISVNKENEIVLSKYSHVFQISDYAAHFCEIASDVLGLNVLICDMDRVIAASGSNRKEFINMNISAALENIINLRRNYMANINDNSMFIKIFEADSYTYTGQIVVPIISNSDLLGAVVAVNFANKKLGFDEIKVAQTIAKFLAKQLE